MKSSITVADIHTLVAHNGMTSALHTLFSAHRSKRLRDLAAIYHLLVDETPELAKQSDFIDRFNDFKRLPGAITSQIANYPAFGYWCVVAIELLQRRANQLFPQHHILTHLRSFSRFLVSAHILDGGTTALRCYLDKNGLVALPGLHVAVLAGPQYAGKPIEVKVNADRVCFQLGTTQQVDLARTDFLAWVDEPVYPITSKRGSELKLRWAPRLGTVLELNDFDSDLKLSERPGAFGALDAAQVNNWREVFDRAWQVLEAVDQPVIGEITDCLKTIIPVPSHNTEVHLSGSYGELFGGIHMSWSSETMVMLEALVHEYRHNKLNALLSTDPIVVGPTAENKFYSAFRKDPRPLTGLLHAIFSFQGVVDLWINVLQHPQLLSAKEQEWVTQRVYKCYNMVKSTREELRSKGVFSEFGEVVMAGLEEAATYNVVIEPRPAIRQLIDGQLIGHRHQWSVTYGQAAPKLDALDPLGLDPIWNAQGGHIASSLPDLPVELTADSFAYGDEHDALPAQLQDWLGKSVSGLGQHYLGWQFGLLQQCAILKSRQPENYSDLVRAAAESVETPSLMMLRAHLHYVEGNFEEAAALYEKYLALYPKQTNVWRLYGFALRHLGYLAEFEVTTFYPAAVSIYAQRYLHDGAKPLGQLRIVHPRQGSDSHHLLTWMVNQLHARAAEDAE